MSLHIIIDGYNLIRQSKTLSAVDQLDLQLGREALLDRLSAYKRVKKHKITVVFDGSNAPSFSDERDLFKGLSIRFSRAGELADAVIKRMAARERERALIVSSDRDIIDAASAAGAATIGSHEFEERISLAIYAESNGFGTDEEDRAGWVPTTKKRGPSRRRSKRERRSRTKIQKL